MFVPVILGLSTSNPQPYLWIFYKFLDKAKEFGYPIIALEEYFEKPSYYKEIKRSEATPENSKYFDYATPQDEDLDKIMCCPIPQIIIDELVIKSSNSINDAYAKLLTQRYEPLEDIIEKYINEIEKKFNKKVDAIVTINPYISISTISEKRNIKTIYWEVGAFREPSYYKTYFFSFVNIWKSGEVEKKYSQFLEEIKTLKNFTPISKKIMLSLLLKTEHLSLLEKYDCKPEFPIGVALGYAVYVPFLTQSFFNDEELLFRLRKIYNKNDILVRKHPGDPAQVAYPTLIEKLDNSLSSANFILRCESIASVGSNISMEATFWNRCSYIKNQCAAYFKLCHNLNENAIVLNDIKYLNWFAFVLSIPNELFCDYEYFEWRLSNPTEKEIYEKHLDYYLNNRGIAKNLFQKIIKMKNEDSALSIIKGTIENNKNNS
jgi:hypothetical protein